MDSHYMVIRSMLRMTEQMEKEECKNGPIVVQFGLLAYLLATRRKGATGLVVDWTGSNPVIYTKQQTDTIN